MCFAHHVSDTSAGESSLCTFLKGVLSSTSFRHAHTCTHVVSHITPSYLYFKWCTESLYESDASCMHFGIPVIVVGATNPTRLSAVEKHTEGRLLH